MTAISTEMPPRWGFTIYSYIALDYEITKGWQGHTSVQNVLKDISTFIPVGGTLITVIAGSFNFKVSHFMRLTASLGFAAKYWSASVIFVCPVHRKTEIAVFRRAAMT